MSVAALPRSPSAAPLAGVVAMVVTLTMWSAFALSIRAMGHSALSHADMALVRFAIPLLALAPFLPSRWAALRRVRPGAALLVMAGGGLPFFLLASAGGASTSAAYVGSFIPGGAPIFVALAYAVFERRRIARLNLCGLALIALGAVALVGPDMLQARPGMGEGALLLLGAGALWAAYTIGLRQAGLDPVASALLLCGPSTAITLGLIAAGVLPSHMTAAPLPGLAAFVAVQGVGVGVISGLAYVRAIALLGAARSAAIGAASPALTALAAVPLLGERLSLPIILGVSLVTVGVLLAQRMPAVRA